MSGSFDKSESSQMTSKFEASSESNKLIVVGASPKGDVLEWAQQTVNENMPVRGWLKSAFCPV